MNTYFTNAYMLDSAYVQLIKVPVYASANVNGTLTPQTWNPGTGTGGVLVFFVTGTLTLNANISADGDGFSGVTCLKEPLGCDLDTNFYYQTTIWNYASCTTCGYIYDDSPTRYADAVAYGGCAAPCQTNRMSSSDWKQAGFRGEGIVSFTFKKTFANANVAYFKLGKAKWGNGGGAGGSILMNVSGSYTNAVTIQAKGGKGGDHNNNTCHGTGGGGGGGVLWFSQGSTPANVTTNVTGGANGIQVAVSIDCGDINWGATAGSAGAVLYGTDPGSTYFLNMNDCNFVLPVELVSFEGTVSEQGVELNWTTASEVNNDHFSIERTEDLMTYAIIGSISASGNSSVSKDYNFYDNHAPAKELFYRLKQVDFDGKVHYPGKLVRVNNQDAGHMPIISPNPNDGKQFTLNLADYDEKEVLVRIVNDMGVIVWQEVIDLS